MVEALLTRLGGAPPRAWGGLTAIVYPSPDQRSTPTCVGRTAVHDTAATLTWEHPHVRGEDAWIDAGAPGGSGAPPRAWGGHFVTCGFISRGSGFASVESWCRMAVVAC